MDNFSGMTSFDMVMIFLSFLSVIIFITIIKKVYYRFRYKKRYYIMPRTNIKGISYIAMVIALSIVILLLLTIITSNLLAVVFRAFPGTRITLEGILIKIGGLLFGPFIGMFIGGATDLLTIALTAGVFHYGYFIGAITYGLLGGLIRSLVNFSKRKEWKFALYSSLSIILVSFFISMYFAFFQEGAYNFTLTISLLSYDIEIKIWHIILMICATATLGIILIMTLFFASKRSTKKLIKDQFMSFCPVVSLVFISEIFVNLFMLPVFDVDLSTLGYPQWIAIRGLLFIPLVFANTIIVWPIYKIVYPLIGYEYENDIVEDLKVPLINY
ncbi:MAG: hypothetical protein ACRCVI_01565 [Mycoplasmoidaceae bacterium]